MHWKCKKNCACLDYQALHIMVCYFFPRYGYQDSSLMECWASQTDELGFNTRSCVSYPSSKQKQASL